MPVSIVRPTGPFGGEARLRPSASRHAFEISSRANLLHGEWPRRGASLGPARSACSPMCPAPARATSEARPCNDRSRYGRFTNSANSRANSDSLNPLASPATSRALERKKGSPCWAAGRQRRTRPALRPPGRQGHADRDTTGPPCPDRRFRIQEGAGGTSCLWRTSGPGGQVLPRRASIVDTSQDRHPNPRKCVRIPWDSCGALLGPRSARTGRPF
jgi:hypothetical protein